MITYKQLTLAEIFEDCQNKFSNDKCQFLTLFDEAINLDEIVPVSFISHFHAHTGRPRKHQLYPMLKALLIQRIFSIPTDTLLIVFLKYSQELRDFCGFDVVPDGSKFTRFKQMCIRDRFRAASSISAQCSKSLSDSTSSLNSIGRCISRYALRSLP